MVNGEIGGRIIQSLWDNRTMSGLSVALQWLYNEQKTKEWRTENEPTMKVRRI